ncbi:MAG: YgaP family membrane protein [Sulfuriferula sp.]
MLGNVGSTDRIIRIVVGITLIALAATGTIGYWGYIGVIPLATGFIGWCPAYLPFGIKTCRIKPK